MKKIIISMVIMFLSANVHAVNTWYFGTVTQVITYQDDGSFMVYLDNQEIKNTCAYKRVNFTVTNMGAERTKAALSMAMTALVGGKQYGVVVDLPPQGSVCSVPSSSSQGAGIK